MILRNVFLITCLSFLFYWGCAPKTAPVPQTTVTVAPDVGAPPPVPPKAEMVMEPPRVTVTKPVRDPFIPLVGEGAATGMPTIPELGGPGEKPPGIQPPVLEAPPYRVAGILADREIIAIIESGSNSWAVRKGDKVDQWIVVSIGSHNVVLKKDSEEIKLTTPTGGG